MPMYEFFCPDCNTIFTFFSRTVNTEKKPACPKCGRQGLERMISRFAVTGRAGESAPGEGAGDLGQLDTGRMEKAMEAMASMASEAEGIDENNPRQAADLMRRFSAMTGLRLGDKMEDALSRLEAGEDPEALEKDMADLDESDLFKLDRAGEAAGKKARSVRRKAPLRDETMYEL